MNNAMDCTQPLLLPHHLDQLTRGSGLASEVIRERGYRSATSTAELKRLGFSPAQCRPDGLLLPVWTPDGGNGLYCYRPDVPRVDRDGRVLKYELPKGAAMRLDVPPRCRPRLGDPSIPLWITEGQKKEDALASRGFTVVGVLGVWNFKGRNDYGGVVWLAD